MGTEVNIGVEQVLFAAATDRAFRRALLVSREAALRDRGFQLGATELAMLRDVSDAQLRANIDNMDVSMQNQQRRSFLRVVAAGAMTVAAADALAACSGGVDTGVRPDVPDQAVPDAARPDAGAGDSAGQDVSADTQASPDRAWLDIKTSWGSRPGG